MSLLPTQLATLKAAILADPTLSAQPNTNVGNSIIAATLNGEAVPAFIVWRTSVAMADVLRAFIAADWTEVDGLTVGKARIWDWLRDLGSIDPSSAAIRAAIEECWKGTTARLAVQARVLDSCKRSALLIEKILASGTGSSASPAVLGREGTITPDEIEQARSS